MKISLVIRLRSCYDATMKETDDLLRRVQTIESPLKRQLWIVGLIGYLLEREGKPPPVIIGGCALSYYSREVYFTADIDLAYPDREALDAVLKKIGFEKRGRYWVSDRLGIAVEAPASVLAGEEAPLEVVELGEGLQCRVIGVEDLVIDRLNACKHWKSEVDCEMVELLVRRYFGELDWSYLEKKASQPENDILEELRELKRRASP